MVDLTLLIGAALMGVAGVPHCLAMCGASSGAVVRGCATRGALSTSAGFQFGRLAGYAAAGAVAASSVGALRWMGEVTPALRPVWTLLQVAAAALGGWLLCTGRQPAWMSAWPGRGVRVPAQGAWQPVAGPARAAGLGALWVAWPCGLLQSALVVAALASSALSGAAVMAVFALASSPGLWGAAALMRRLGGAGASYPWTVRLSGLALVAGATWALGHGVWMRVAAYCLPG